MSIIPHPHNEAQRVKTLAAYELMDSGYDRDFDAIAEIASNICGIPISLITFIDENRQYFKSHVGTDVTENARELSFCTHAIASSEEIMIVNDARIDVRFANNPMVTGPTKLVFYAGVPLINEGGYALGTICVLDQKSHHLTDSQIRALKSLAKQIVDKIELKRKIAHLEQRNDALAKANILIQNFASMAAHDIKNPLSSILLTSQLLRKDASTSKDDRTSKLLEMNIASSKSLISLVDDMLEYSRSPELLFARKQKVSVHELFERVSSLSVIPENFKVSFTSNLVEMYFSSIAIEQILLNLLSNAIRYNNKARGTVNIEISEDSFHYILTLADNGNGIAAEYHEKIFDANFTLQDKDRLGSRSNGIGLSTVKNLVDSLRGSIRLTSLIDKGCTFTLSFPKK
jgi:signal transduction histidine kinase